MKKVYTLLVIAALAVLSACSSPQAMDEGETYIAIVQPAAVALGAQADGGVSAFDATVDALAQDYGLAAESLTPLSSLRALIIKSLTPEQAEALANDPRIYSLTKDREVHATRGGPPSGEELSEQVVPWGIERIGATTTVAKGSGVSVYVVDTGIKIGHEDLQDNYDSADGFAVVECRGSGCLAPWDDDNGHGTHVSGTIGAVDNDLGVIGVAPQVTLHAVKVLSKTGSGSTSGIITGIEWVIDHDNGGAPKVINMSLGGAGSDDQDGEYCPEVRSTDAFHNVIQRAVCDYNITVVVAAGNEDADASTSTPAAYDEVITVSATNSDDDWPYWSNYGEDVDIAAPGVDILSTWNDGTYNTISGTSMATPHVTGAAAVVLSANPGFTPLQVKEALLANAEDTSSWTNTSGNPHPEPFLNLRGF
ncbi:S8 family serine peptidase [Oceanithermus sp.]